MAHRLLMSLTVLAVLALSTPAPSQDVPLVLWYPAPANQWIEALPIGNGRLAAMVFGKTADERIQFNEDTFWAAGPYDPSHADALAALPEARKLIFEGKYRDAHTLINRRMMARPIRQMPYQPVGDLKLSLPGHEKATAYRRELNLRTGVTSVSYRVGDITFRRQVFASPVDEVIVVRLTADKGGKLDFAATMTSPQADFSLGAEGDNQLVLSASGPDCQKVKGVLKAQARLRVTIDGGTLQADKDKLVVRGADSATLLLAAATNYVNWKDVSADQAARARKCISDVGSKPFARILADHVAAHRKLMDRVELDLGSSPAALDTPTDKRIKAFSEADPHLAVLYFQFGRYLLISGSRPGSQPANLQGKWNESTRPPWDSKYTININTEMNYWPAEPTNLSECHEPLLRAVSELSEPGAKTARTNWGAGGWVCHHNFDIWRATAPIDGATWGFWPTGGAWLCRHLWEHYLFTGDDAFLKKAYPLMKGAAEFFLDSLVEHPTKKLLVTCPSLSPENQHPFRASVCAGPAMDSQIIRDLFDACIESAPIVAGGDASFVARVKAARDRLQPHQVGQAGQLQEWLDDWDMKAPEIHHRHVSHLYALFPSNQITTATPDLLAAARKSLQVRGDGGTGWSKAWKINLWARLGEGDHAFKMYRELITQSTGPDMFDLCPPFQIDGNFGGCSGVTEMLLQSHAVTVHPVRQGELRLLPALPKAWPAGSVKGLRGRGGFVVAMTWKDGKLTEAAITSLLGKPCKVHYGDKTVELTIPKGQTVTLNSSLDKR